MREIKFKQFVDGEWYYFGWLDENTFTMPTKTNIEKYPAVQFSGMRDEFDADIYEGDEVSFINDYDCQESGVVELTECGRWIVKTKESYKMLYDVCAIVIGNVYEI